MTYVLENRHYETSCFMILMNAFQESSEILSILIPVLFCLAVLDGGFKGVCVSVLGCGFSYVFAFLLLVDFVWSYNLTDVRWLL